MEMPGVGQEARNQALAQARRERLPVTARSLTEKEVAKIDGRAPAVLLGIYGLFAMPLLAFLAFGGAARSLGALALGVAAALAMAAILWLVGRRWSRRRSSYRDPLIEVEIGEHGASIRSPGRVDALDYAEAIVTFNVARVNRVGHFMGLVLESPLGPLRLDDLWFKPGRSAAAALAGRLEERGVLPAIG